ncbi:MAG: hypothetical protein HKP61_09830, partial [Dactylosporangium sp.]|nr:hypothetical protein [Dactylosporangium sp.]NNJ61230.1 hypothetical protein [Dactylosporangium sp.]
MGQHNELLRRARLNTPSPSDPGGAMTRQELAEAVNAYLLATTGRVFSMDGEHIGKYERGGAPRGAWLYSRLSREELEGRFLGPMACLDPKGEGDR